MAGKKTSIYLTDEDSARLDAVHEAMRRAPSLRQFDLKWSDTLRLLLRRALAVAELEYLHKIPEDAEASEWLEELEKQYQKQYEILREIDEQEWRAFAKESPGLAARFKPSMFSDEEWDELVKERPSLAKHRNRYLASKKNDGE
jgi:hypothetical protein